MSKTQYILPNFYESFSCNQLLIQEFLKSKMLYGVSGTFPFSIFNGGINNNGLCDLVVYDDIISISRSYGPLNDFMLIDCSNISLLSTDYNDCFNKVMFETLSEKENVIFSIADIELGKYLIKTYPTIQLTLDANYTLFHTDDDINLAIKTLGGNLKYLMICQQNLCKKIIFPKIYKVFFTECNCCLQHLRCIKQENERVLTYSEKSCFKSCSLKKSRTYKDILTEIENISNTTTLIAFESIPKEQEEQYYSILEQIIMEGN